jgi:hypothetical protein
LPMYETKEETELYLKAVIHADTDGQFGLEWKLIQYFFLNNVIIRGSSNTKKTKEKK